MRGCWRRSARLPAPDSSPPIPADRDEPIPIGHRQVTTQPSLSARMIEGLHLASGDHVLEIGTGLGFQTALLARLAARVISIERWPDLAGQARRNLARQGLGNAEVLAGDGSRGLPEGAPYDAILVSAAFPQVPAPLAAQLRIGGRLVQPSGQAAVSRWCCSSGPHPGWSGGKYSPWPGSSGCTGATDSSPGPDRARTSCLSRRRARTCSPATCLRPCSCAPRCLAGTPSALPVPLLVTLRNKPSSGETRTLPPICADVDGISIKTPAVQIWTICVPESSHEHGVLSYCAFPLALASGSSASRWRGGSCI